MTTHDDVISSSQAIEVPTVATPSPVRQEQWGQPPAERYVFRREGTAFVGEQVQVVFLSSRDELPAEPTLADELFLWQRAGKSSWLAIEGCADA